MAIMVGMVSALSAFLSDGFLIHVEQQREKAAITLLGKLPVIAAAI